MVHAHDFTPFLDKIELLPRLLALDTPGVHATTPLLRGVWGAALHDLDPAAYQAVFAPEGSNSPPAYLLRPAPPDPEIAPAVHWFLFGPALAHDESLRRAWDFAGGMGLGPERRRWFVRRWAVLGPDGGPSAEGRPWRLSQASWPLSGPADAGPCRLAFPAPLRLLRQGRLIDQPTLADLTVAAGRRVAALLPAGDLPAWDRLQKDALDLARGRPARPWRGARLDLVRWSGRQRVELELRGVAGELDLPEGLGELWPLFAASAWTHLGKGTTVGMGEIRVLPLVAMMLS